MNTKRWILLLIATCFYSSSVMATTNAQSNISDQCETAHMMGGMGVQAEIEANCSAAQEGSQFTGSTLSGNQIRDTANKFSNLVKSVFSFGASQFANVGTYNIETTDGKTGINAGSVLGGLSFWGNLSYTDSENDFSNTLWDSDTKNILVGAHGNLKDNMILGASFGYEDTNVDTFFNGGEQEIDGYTFAGYFGWLINDWISFDAAGGYSWSNIDQNRQVSDFEVTAGTTFGALGAGSIVTSDIDSDTWFVSTNLTAFKTYGRWVVDGHVGYLRSETEHDDSFETGGGLTAAVAEQDFELGQIRVGFNLGYQWQNNMEPFVGVDYINDHTFDKVRISSALEQPANDDDEFQVSAGFRYFGETLGGILQFRNNFGREDIDNFSVEAVISGSF